MRCIISIQKRKKIGAWVAGDGMLSFVFVKHIHIWKMGLGAWTTLLQYNIYNQVMHHTHTHSVQCSDRTQCTRGRWWRSYSVGGCFAYHYHSASISVCHKEQRITKIIIHQMCCAVLYTRSVTLQPLNRCGAAWRCMSKGHVHVYFF